MRPTILVILALLGMATAAAAPAAPHPVEVVWGQAMAAAEAGDWLAYLQACERGLELAPGQPALQRRRAEALAQLGRGDEAMAALQALGNWGVAADLTGSPLLEPLRGRADWPQLITATAAALAPRGTALNTFATPEADLVPEGLAWDPVDDAFYLGSVAKRKIVRIGRDGVATDFIAPGAHGYLAGLGLAVDPKARQLWAVSTAQADDGLFDAATNGTSALHVFDLATGALLWRHVTAQADSLGFNDVCLLPGGGAAVSVADRGQVLRFGPDGGAPVALTAPGSVPGANGLCVGPGGDALYVSAYVLGIQRVDLATGAVTAAAMPGADFTTVGVDGLYLLPGARELIAVQNHNGLDRVACFALGEGGLLEGCRVLVARLPRFVDPTTGAVAPDGFHFIADSHVSPFYQRPDKSVRAGFGTSSVVKVRCE